MLAIIMTKQGQQTEPAQDLTVNGKVLTTITDIPVAVRYCLDNNIHLNAFNFIAQADLTTAEGAVAAISEVRSLTQACAESNSGIFMNLTSDADKDLITKVASEVNDKMTNAGSPLGACLVMIDHLHKQDLTHVIKSIMYNDTGHEFNLGIISTKEPSPDEVKQLQQLNELQGLLTQLKNLTK